MVQSTMGGSNKSVSNETINLPGLTLDKSAPYLAKNDPKRDEAWWWMAVPLLMAAIIIGIAQIAPLWYQSYMHPEGYGVLELLHFFVPLAAMFIGIKLLFNTQIRVSRLLTGFVSLATLACLYVAGEEMSWGQHFFH